MGKKYLAPSVRKAFKILKVISVSRRGMGLNEIARTLNIAKSTVHGITSILEDVGALTRDASTRRYELGLTLFELGRQAYSQIDLKEIARPVMEELMESVQETVFLGTLSGDRKSILVLDVVECRHNFKITFTVGSTLPLFAGAPGKVLLSSMAKDDVWHIIKERGLPAYTDNSITDPERFFKEIRNVKNNGYATDYEEYMSGVRAIAAPVHGEKNRIATLYIVGFKANLNKDKMDILKNKVIEAALTINRNVRERLH